MASNPLLGSRISLISKNNIRYEGTLYSINEADAQVALQNVKSYGTEGRELLDTTGASTYVPPNDVVHAYLLFRGQDIKDLHVHEKAATTSDVVPPPAAAPAPATTTTRANVTSNTPAPATTTQTSSNRAAAAAQPADKESKQVVPDKSISAPDNKDAPSKATRNSAGTSNNNSGNNNKEQPKKTTSSANNGGAGRKNQNMVGTGASLLNRKARGAKGNQDLAVEGEFDFESNLAEFDKVSTTTSSNEPPGTGGNGGGDDPVDVDPYSKDDFFDTISSEATDRINGIDNRLRGAAERNLNLDTFGAVSLGNNRRNYYGGRGGGRGDGGYYGGGRGGRGGGRGRGRGGGRGYNNNYNDRREGGGPAPRQNNRWKESSST